MPFRAEHDQLHTAKEGRGADPMPEMLTVGDLAKLFQKSEATIRYWRHTGYGPKGTKFGRRVLFRRADVDAWIAAQEAAEHGPSGR